MRVTHALPRSWLRPRTATLAPAAARPSASAPPSTPVAPMTTATSPVRSKRFSLMFLVVRASRPRSVDKQDAGETPAPRLDRPQLRAVKRHARFFGDHV